MNKIVCPDIPDIISDVQEQNLPWYRGLRVMRMYRVKPSSAVMPTLTKFDLEYPGNLGAEI
jgi:hypothetical protein